MAGPNSDLIADKRTVTSAGMFDDGPTEWVVGEGGVACIEVYGEPSYYCDIATVRVVMEDGSAIVFPASHGWICFAAEGE